MTEAISFFIQLLICQQCFTFLLQQQQQQQQQTVFTTKESAMEAWL